MRANAPSTPLLVFVGGFNGLIPPIGLTVFMYIGWFRRDLLGTKRYPLVLLIAGALVTLLTWCMGNVSVGPIFAFLGTGARQCRPST